MIEHDPDELKRALAFLRDAEKLKDTLRSGFTSDGRPESTAEHTWRLCLMVIVFAGRLPNVNILKLLKMCLVHDLGEAHVGDVPAIHQVEGDGRKQAEKNAMRSMTNALGGSVGDEIFGLCEEYEAAETPEALLAKGFDKLETILQHTQGKNPDDFDYDFNLNYGCRQTDADPLLSAIRELIDIETAARLRGKPAWQS